jgi:PKD repeat protein
MTKRLGSLIAIIAVAAAGCSSEASDSTQSTSDPTATTALAVPHEPLRADFTFEITYEEPSASYCPVRSIQFTDQSIGSPEAWKWEFPDGETSTEPNPVVTVAMWGTVTLTVEANGESDRVSQDITTVEC